MTYKNIDEYIQAYPEDVQKTLEDIRKLIKEVAPSVTEMISYNMPTFDFNGKRVYFAAFKKHIGFYAIGKSSDFESELNPLRAAKDTVQFPLSEQMPYDLIKKIVKYKLFD